MYSQSIALEAPTFKYTKMLVNQAQADWIFSISYLFYFFVALSSKAPHFSEMFEKILFKVLIFLFYAWEELPLADFCGGTPQSSIWWKESEGASISESYLCHCSDNYHKGQCMLSAKCVVRATGGHIEGRRWERAGKNK